MSNFCVWDDDWDDGSEESGANRAWTSEPEEEFDEDESLREADREYWENIDNEVSMQND